MLLLSLDRTPRWRRLVTAVSLACAAAGALASPTQGSTPTPAAPGVLSANVPPATPPLPTAAVLPAAAVLSGIPATIPDDRRPADAGGLPTLGDSARADLSPVLERKLGEEIMNDIRRDPDYLDDDPTIEFLNHFGDNLVSYAPGARGENNVDFFFFAVRDPMINAFALPGGFVAVHSQLLIVAQNESELASVLSHEIGHVQQRHIARMIGQQKQDALLPLAALILAALVGKAGGGGDAALGVMMGGEGLAIQRQLNFSRDAEREADRVGFQTMRAAGYDTSGMVNFFKRLQSSTRVYGEAPAWLSSHPLTGERIADIQARIRENPKPVNIRPDSIEFHLVRARMRVLQDESQKGRDEAREAFKSQLAQQNTQLQTAAMYGMSFLSLKEGDLKAAQSWLDKTRASMHPRPGVLSAERPGTNGTAMFAELSTEIKLAPGQPPEIRHQAVQDALAASQQFPLSRMLAHQYAEALIADGQSDQAATYLREQVRQYREEPKLYDQLAKAYSGQGKIALQHMALAESYVLTGATPAAVDQLNLARKSQDASFYDQAVIDARERELNEKQKDEKKDKKDRGEGFRFSVESGSQTTGTGQDSGKSKDPFGNKADDPFGTRASDPFGTRSLFPSDRLRGPDSGTR